MKVIQKLVIRLSDNVVLEEQSYEYSGPVALCAGGGGGEGGFAGPFYSAAGGIINKLKSPIMANIQKYILGNTNEQLTNRAIQQGINASNAQYGARGLEGSGIAIKGTQEVASDLALKGAQQQANTLIGLLGTGSSSPSVTSLAPSQGGGLFGK